MNSAVRSIFNEIFSKKEVCGSCEQCTRPTGNTPQSQKCASKKKKKEKKTQMQDAAFSSVPKRVHKIRLDITYFDEN